MEEMARDLRMEKRRSWIALYAVCLGVLIVVLDSTATNVLLPSIREDLKFTDRALVWVANAYMLAFGGAQLLAGRLGDLYGRRKVFLGGISLFTWASFCCGAANTGAMLIGARFAQGLGGATILAVALAVIMNMFSSTAERAKAVGVYGLMCAVGGSAGALLSGVIASEFNWRWVFFMNLPIGVICYALCFALLRDSKSAEASREVDIWPLIPPRLFSVPNFVVSNTIGVLVSAGGSAWFFISALYMQQVLGYEPIRIGLAFLPANLIMAAFELGVSPWVIARFGTKNPLAVGIMIMAAGLALFARAPVGGSLVVDILPPMIILSIGEGIAYNALILAAIGDVAPSDSGVASSVFGTAGMVGGGLGLAVVASLAAMHTHMLTALGVPTTVALAGGFRAAFLAGAAFASVAALVSMIFLRESVVRSTVARMPLRLD